MTENSHTEIAESLYLALADDPFYIQLEQKIANAGLNSRAGMLSYYDYSINKAINSGLLIKPESGETWGASLWSIPNKEGTQKTDSALFEQMVGPDAYNHYHLVCDSMSTLSQPYISTEDWYLSIVGITPEMQSKRLGKQLINPVLADADRLGVTTYLETFVPRNISFYQRYGFESVANIKEPVMQSSYQVLVRRPVD